MLADEVAGLNSLLLISRYRDITMLITCASPENDLVHGAFSRDDMQPHIHGNPSLYPCFSFI